MFWSANFFEISRTAGLSSLLWHRNTMTVSQASEAQAIMTRVYRGDDFGDYYSDPPYWSYTSHGSGHSKSAHWLYKNHRYVFIDITLKYASR